MNEERENATQKDHFGLAKLLREKSQSSIEGKVITILIFSYAILKKRFGGRFTFINRLPDVSAPTRRLVTFGTTYYHFGTFFFTNSTLVSMK